MRQSQVVLRYAGVMRVLVMLLLVPFAGAQETSVEKVFTIAVQEQQNGRISDAIRDDREILQRQPDMVEPRVDSFIGLI